MNESTQKASRLIGEEVMNGLRKPQKTLPSKFFYDERGSELFEEITEVEEYYPTRTERQIMEQNIEEIARVIGPESVIIEPGSGSSKKIRLLLDHLPAVAAYIPVEISQNYLSRVVRELRREYPELLIKPVCADYTQSFQLPEINEPFDYYVVFYPGSTIGNFHPREAQAFLEMLSQFMVPGGGLLIGVDLKKDRRILEAAYNDKKGITTAFNKNILVHLNRKLEADFDLDQFEHRAFYNEHKDRIEMHLESRRKQSVSVNEEVFHFEKGETIHTENSYKYSPESFASLVSKWFDVGHVWTDEKKLFSLQYLVKK